MNRDSILQEVLSCTSKSIVLQLATGVGKSKIALTKLADRNCKNILVVVYRNVLIDNWKQEFIKHGFEHLLPNTAFINYKSLYKSSYSLWDGIIFDEAHHLSEDSREILRVLQTQNILFLSATLPDIILYDIKRFYPDTSIFTVDLREAIDSCILKEPRIKLIPLNIEEVSTVEYMSFNTQFTPPVELPLNIFNYWKAIKDKKHHYRLKGSPKEYLNVLNKVIDFYKDKLPFKYRRLCLDRLVWLANLKNSYIKDILKTIAEERSITFCSSIKQAKSLGKYSIHTQNPDSKRVLEQFNDKKLNHIQAVNSLDEGANLVDCKYSIFASLSSSAIKIVQRTGRALRHEAPVIIIPYFIATRDEEIVEQMLPLYSKDSIEYVTLKSFIKQ